MPISTCCHAEIKIMGKGTGPHDSHWAKCLTCLQPCDMERPDHEPCPKCKMPNMRLTKWCWVAMETKKGWRLKFCADKDYPVRGALFGDEEQIKKVVQAGKIVFVRLAEK